MNQHIIAEKVSKALLQLGLTEKEIAVYVALLEKGASSVQEISRFSEINRVTIYAAIDALKRKGLVAESKKGKRTLFIAEHPENLNGILELKKEKLNNQEKILSSFVIPNLSALNINQQDKPEIQFFEGAESMGRVFDNYTLKHKDIIGCGSYEAAAVAINWEEESKFLREIQRRKILYRVILRDTPKDREIAEKFKDCFHVKFLEIEKPLLADIHVFGSYVSLMSYQTLGTTLIKDESIAQSMRLYLEFIWERL